MDKIYWETYSPNFVLLHVMAVLYLNLLIFEECFAFKFVNFSVFTCTRKYYFLIQSYITSIIIILELIKMEIYIIKQ